MLLAHCGLLYFFIGKKSSTKNKKVAALNNMLYFNEINFELFRVKFLLNQWNNTMFFYQKTFFKFGMIYYLEIKKKCNIIYNLIPKNIHWKFFFKKSTGINKMKIYYGLTETLH